MVGAGFKDVKDTRVKGLWNLLPWLRSTAEAWQMARESLHGGSEGPFCEAMNRTLSWETPVY